MASHRKIGFDIGPGLGKDEVVLWVGTPDEHRGPRSARLPGIGTLVGWLCLVVGSATLLVDLGAGHDVSIILMVVGLLILLPIGRVLGTSSGAADLCVVTNERVVIRYGDKPLSLHLALLEDPTLWEAPDGSGSIFFGKVAASGGIDPVRSPTEGSPALRGVKDVRMVHKVIVEAQAAARAKPFTM